MKLVDKNPCNALYIRYIRTQPLATVGNGW